MRRLGIYCALILTSGCFQYGSQKRLSSDEGTSTAQPSRAPHADPHIPFNYEPAKFNERGLFVMMKVLGLDGEDVDPNWPTKVRPIPDEAIALPPGQKVRIGVCLLNRCQEDLFIGSDRGTFGIGCGMSELWGSSTPYPEPYWLLRGLKTSRPGRNAFRDDSFAHYTRTVDVPPLGESGLDASSGELPDLFLNWRFHCYRRGDPTGYYLTEEKRLRVRATPKGLTD